MPKLLEAFPALAQAIRYGSVRQTPTAPILAIAEGLFERILIGLPGACTSLDDDAAHQRREQLRAMHAAVALLEGGTRAEDWSKALEGLTQRDAVHGLVRGAALRLRVELGQVKDEALGVLARKALSTAVPPSEAAAWLEGLVSGSALVLLHRGELWSALDGWLSNLARDTFIEQLPLVRRAFSGFSVSERRAMAEHIRHLSASPRTSHETDASAALDPERVAKVLPILSLLLGVRLDETV
ncbi:conserved hypothetical protein [Stigmatella aurantiaca DW4/3-1]|uniref:Uncharacterized protein n=1 Tax=Stigmatella aurantiaca (strain DW4/3-1) TaxID=378806 RepID=Q08NF1_STIAD|nr:conserved hypothetical protein [Stigmatella aurantiaca DW4/3-1]